MKTPVEWLFDKLWDTPKDKFEWFLIRERALKIEKERIKDARQDGIDSALKGYSVSNEEYYFETFDIENQLHDLYLDFVTTKTSTKYHSEINPECKCHGGYCYRKLDDGTITTICDEAFKTKEK